jgi:dihydroxy-acid dehydratase
VDLSDEEIADRWRRYTPPPLDNQTPSQELFRAYTGQMDTGSCLDFALAYRDIVHTKGLPRDSH